METSRTPGRQLSATAGATNLLRVTFLIPVTAILLSIVAPGETLLPGDLAGTLLIGCGLTAIACRPGRGGGRTIRRRNAPVEVLRHAC